jgi:hypothetical protein
MNEKNALAVYRVIGIWDLALTLPFALPPVIPTEIAFLRTLHGALGGKAAFPEFAPLHLFFVCLFGIMCVLWAVIRIHRPSTLLAWYDAVGRFVVASFMLISAARGITPVAAVFSLSEIGWGLVEFAALYRSRPRVS